MPRAPGDSGKKFVGDLGQNTDTVTGLTFRILTGSVLQILYDLQRILYSSAALLSMNIDTGSDTAVIMLNLICLFLFRTSFARLCFQHFPATKKGRNETLSSASLRPFLYYTPIFLICKYRFFYELSDNLSIQLFTRLLSVNCVNFLF